MTISRNLLPATGPVGAGGDQGRDFETFPTTLPGQVGSVGASVGISDGEPIAFACTLQQRNIRTKIMGDIAKCTSEGAEIRWIVAYCEVDIPIAVRHRIEQEAQERHDIRLVVFDGNAIADLLVSRAEELRVILDECLHVRQERPTLAVPRDLPRAPLRFVNRDRQLAELDTLADDAAQALGPKVALLAGMRGVGKSAIGCAWAHRNRNRFDGGDLFGDFSNAGAAPLLT